jgi:tetratricopeptide (TPR) repeat protein
MEFLSWRNLFVILLGAVLAGAAVGAFKLYENHKREAIGEKLYRVEKLLYQNKTQEAIREATDIPPPSRSYAYLKIADYLYSKGKGEEALKFLHGAEKELRDTDKPLYYFTVQKEAYLLYRLGYYKKSLGLLNSLPEDVPNFCEVAFLKARNYLTLGKREKTLELIGRIVEVCPDPNLVMAVKYLAVELEKKKD